MSNIAVRVRLSNDCRAAWKNNSLGSTELRVSPSETGNRSSFFFHHLKIMATSLSVSLSKHHSLVYSMSMKKSIRIWLCFVLFVYLCSTASAAYPGEVVGRGIRSAEAGRAVFESDSLSVPDKEDLCGICECTGDKPVTINCDLSKHKNLHKKFGANFKMDRMATSLRILLPPGAHVYFERGFFENTYINGVVIEGKMQGEQVEITSGVFDENMGQYPEIQILNCHSVILQPKSFKGDFKLLIEQSHDVVIFGNAFVDASLTANFTKIDDLRIEEQTFHNNKAVININYSHMDNIYPFKTSLSMITFSHCTIGTINSGAFDVNSIPSIRFNACEINVIRSKAITEKLQSKELAITETVIGTIETEAISGGISELVLSGNRINKIQTNAIQVTAINVTIHDNNIMHLERKWLYVRDWSNVVVKNNMIGEFGEMTFESPPSAKRLSTCRFEENYLTKPLPGSLNMPHLFCQFHKNSIKKQCTCNTTWLEELSDRDLRSESYCMLEGTLERCYNTTMINYAKYINDVCDETKTQIDCRNESVRRIDGKFYTEEELREREDNFKIGWILLYITIAILLLSSLLVIIYFCHRSIARKRMVGEATTNHVHEFSENDMRLIDQHLKIIKSRYPRKYSAYRRLVQDFTRPNNRSEKCSDLIVKITDFLLSCEDAKRDFADFKEILRKHFDPMPSAPVEVPSEPIYTELTPPANDSPHEDAHASLLEHTYEYTHPESLLPEGEYALPHDGYVDAGGHYSEPINYRNPQLYATPTVAGPATSTTVQQQTSQALRPPIPSVFQIPKTTSTKPQTKVQRMAQNLEIGHFPQYADIDRSRKNTKKPSLSSPIASGSAIATTSRPQFGLNATSSSDSGSNHSGGSDVTTKIDDIIEYADA